MNDHIPVGKVVYVYTYHGYIGVLPSQERIQTTLGGLTVDGSRRAIVISERLFQPWFDDSQLQRFAEPGHYVIFTDRDGHSPRFIPCEFLHEKRHDV